MTHRARGRDADERPASTTRPIALAALLLLAGCADTPPVRAPQWRLEPFASVTPSSRASAAGYYRLGHYHAGMRAWDRAIEAYRKAIADDPQDIEARNALGVALAQSGRYDDAASVLRAAVAMSPKDAHVVSNLGYTMLLAGRPAEAVAHFEAALRLDPGQRIAMTNLRQAMARLPQAPTTLATEATVAASGSLGMRVVDRPTVAAFGTAGSAASASSTAPVREMPPGVELAGARLELSNGSGVAGAAARMREWLGTQGVAAHRLTNHRTFSQQYTTLQYRDGQEGEARRLATVLPVGVPLQRTNQLRTDLRIVIGHDWKPPVDAARISRGANRATHFASAR